MQESKFVVLFKRFLRGFIATAIPIATVELSKGYDLSNPADLKKFAFALITPLVAGFLLAGEKALRWEAPTEPVEIDTIPNED